MKSRCIIIVGPTAVGKTAVSLTLAKQLPIEIINGDMAQMYTPLSIGTAKPTPDERTHIPHHLFDILDEPCSYTVVQYRAAVEQLIEEIVARGNIPVIVGGSSFYVRSLFFKIDESESGEIGENDITTYQETTTSELWNRLLEIDSERAHQIHAHDRYRIIRALTLWDRFGKKPSLYKPQFNPVADSSALIVLSRSKEDLISRISIRVEQMIQAGFKQEVHSLDDRWKRFVTVKKIIGYPEILQIHDTRQLIDTITLHTTQYAKKQNTFNKAFIKQLEQYPQQVRVYQVNLTISDDSLYIEQLVREIERVL